MTRRLCLAIVLLSTSIARLHAGEPAPVLLSIQDFAFDPAEITVPPGTTVVWTNRDDIPHTVTDDAAPREFTSAALDTGETFSYRFDRAGRFSYFCKLHPHMQGVVVVR